MVVGETWLFDLYPTEADVTAGDVRVAFLPHDYLSPSPADSWPNKSVSTFVLCSECVL